MDNHSQQIGTAMVATANIANRIALDDPDPLRLPSLNRRCHDIDQVDVTDDNQLAVNSSQLKLVDDVTNQNDTSTVSPFPVVCLIPCEPCRVVFAIRIIRRGSPSSTE